MIVADIQKWYFFFRGVILRIWGNNISKYATLYVWRFAPYIHTVSCGIKLLHAWRKQGLQHNLLIQKKTWFWRGVYTFNYYIINFLVAWLIYNLFQWLLFKQAFFISFFNFIVNLTHESKPIFIFCIALSEVLVVVTTTIYILK